MDHHEPLDSLFRQAVSAIDAGDVIELTRFLAIHPALLHDRLDSPGTWLRGKVGDALEGYFRQPCLLWFVAENPVRNDRLPENIAEVTRAIIQAAEREGVANLQEQLTCTLGLVCTGRVARECGVQIELIDVLIDAGAVPGTGTGALAAGNLAAAERLVERGGELTLAVAVCLGWTADAARLASDASAGDRQIALAAAALNGNARALGMLIDLGVDLNAYSTGIHPHATALHHAASSGSLDAVRVLVAAGARLGTRDLVYQATPLGWAEYYRHHDIAAYLRERGGQR